MSVYLKESVYSYKVGGGGGGGGVRYKHYEVFVLYI